MCGQMGPAGTFFDAYLVPEDRDRFRRRVIKMPVQGIEQSCELFIRQSGDRPLRPPGIIEDPEKSQLGHRPPGPFRGGAARRLPIQSVEL